MNKLEKIAPGVVMCIMIAIPAWILGRMFPVVGGPVFGILIGMIAAAFKRPNMLEEGIRYTSKKILQYSIVLLGFEMDLFNVMRVGSQSLAVIFFTLSASFVTAFVIGRALKIKGKTAVLIGVGTSICGGSAIAATAPVIQAQDEDVAHSISTIFLFNIIAVFIFPHLGRMLGMSDTGFGMWAGTAINDTSSVVAAGAAWSSYAGSDAALNFATIVKLTRTLMIVPITLALAVYTSRRGEEQEGTGGFSVARVFPWFVIWFVAAAVANTFAGIPNEVSHNLAVAGKFLIVMAMAAIGASTNMKKLLGNGIRPILLGVCCWLAVAVTSLTVQNFINIW